MKSKTYSSVFRLRKLKTNAEISGACQHNSRKKPPRNADPKRVGKNKVLVGAGQTILEAVENRIKQCAIKPRKNAVRAVEFIQSAGRDFFRKVDPPDAWIQQSLDFLRQKFGADNLVHVTLHDDEKTLHLHAIVVPVVAANDDKAGLINRKTKKRVWKLDAKGIFEQEAHLRPRGLDDAAAAQFRLSDFKTAQRFLKAIAARKDPVSDFLATSITPAALALLTKSKAKISEKGPVLIEEMNRILNGPIIFEAARFADIKLSGEIVELKDRNPTGDDAIRLNRKLLDAAFPELIHPSIGRLLGSPTGPFLHRLQKEYYTLCKALDSGLSEPLYHAKVSHTALGEYYGIIENEIKHTGALLQIDPPLPDDLNILAPKEYLKRETTRIRKALEHLLADAAEAPILREELESIKSAVRHTNAYYEPENNLQLAENRQLKKQNDELKSENARLSAQFRTIPLDQVLSKLGFGQRVPGREDQYHLPDERIIQISGAKFSELTGRGGIGEMKRRQQGKGAVDLVMFAAGWPLSLALKWLKNNFDLTLALNEAATKTKEDQQILLQVDNNQYEDDEFQRHQDAFYSPDKEQWKTVASSLVTEYAFDPDLLEKLHSQNVIAANKYGAFIANKLSRGEVVGTIAQAVKPNPTTGATYKETFQDANFPFIIGNPKADITVIVSNPIEAMALYEASDRNAYVLAIESELPPGIVARLAQRDTPFPVYLAQEATPAGKAAAEKYAIQLEKAGIKTARHEPPPFHPHANSWVHLLRAGKNKLEMFAGTTLESAKNAFQECREWFVTRSSLDPQSPEK